MNLKKNVVISRSSKLKELLMFVDGLTRICEAFYRLGVKDGAFDGDKSVCESVEPLTLLNSNNGKPMSVSCYCDYIAFQCNSMGLNNFKDAILYSDMQRGMKMVVIRLIDREYRNGLVDGLSFQKTDSVNFYKSMNGGKNHNRPIQNIKMTQFKYIDYLRIKLREIASDFDDDKYFNKFSNMMIEAVRRIKYEKEVGK